MAAFYCEMVGRGILIVGGGWRIGRGTITPLGHFNPGLDNISSCFYLTQTMISMS